MYKKIVPYLSIFLITVFEARANPVIEYLKGLDSEFDHASLSKKAEMATCPVNENYLISLKAGDGIDLESLTHSKSRQSPDEFVELRRTETTSPVALSLVTGQLDIFQKFLGSMEDVNASVTWGWRQHYTLAHLALNPTYPLPFDVSLATRLAIIDALGDREADFNITGNDIYANPPLFAGYSSGRHVDEFETLRLRAMLYGADPDVHGGSFSGRPDLNLPKSKIFQERMGLLFDWYVEKLKLGQGAHLRPVGQIMRILEDIAKERGMPDFPYRVIASEDLKNSEGDLPSVKARENIDEPEEGGTTPIVDEELDKRKQSEFERKQQEVTYRSQEEEEERRFVESSLSSSQPIHLPSQDSQVGSKFFRDCRLY